ncbi:putative conserved membrane protein [Mycobacteroides abscessus subsp. abscessus]|nr:putative conserved membrane protein [Mycobacteroides abscessus subsp. abscessus]
MAAIAPVKIPTKSEIFQWTTTHLHEAATAWEKAADESERAFEQHVNNVRAPSGTEWTGAGATAAYDDAREAQDTVRTQCSIKRELARIARRGAEDIDGAKRTSVNAIQEVEGKGYQVAEDLKVTDARSGGSDAERAARKAEAQQLTEFLRWHAQGLASTDEKVGQELIAEAQGLEGRKLTKGGDGTVQMLDDGDKSRNDRINDRDAKHPDGRDRDPDGADGQRGRNDETWRRPEGGRNREGKLGWLESDWAGRAILERYLYGEGKEWDIDNDPSWSEYMKGDDVLARNLDSHVRSQAQQALLDYQQGKGDFQGFGSRFHGEMENGEAISGRQYLHGTNNDVGDFQLGGTTKVESLPDGNYKVTVHGRYNWNDIIDPNFDYQTDRMKEQWARIISLGQAQPYNIRINWEADTQFVFDKNGKPIDIKGYPYK